MPPGEGRWRGMIAKHLPNKGRNVRASSVSGPILSFIRPFNGFDTRIPAGAGVANFPQSVCLIRNLPSALSRRFELLNTKSQRKQLTTERIRSRIEKLAVHYFQWSFVLIFWLRAELDDWFLVIIFVFQVDYFNDERINNEVATINQSQLSCHFCT